MIVVAILAVLTLLAIFANKYIRKYNVQIYIVAVVIAVVAFIFRTKTLNPNIFKLMTPINKGFMGLSFFYLVMLAGALPKKSKFRKKLLGVRREYSIIGFIIVTPHALNYIIKWIDGSRSIEWWGFIAFAIMIPLFVTSFSKIRKKMTSKHWKLLQSLAYFVYILLFIHLILNYSLKINLVLYLILFIGYFLLKGYFEINKYLAKKKSKK